VARGIPRYIRLTYGLPSLHPTLFSGMTLMRASRLIALAALLPIVAPVSGFAAEPASPQEKVRQVIQSRYPTIRIQKVEAVPGADLFEIFTGDAIAYSNASGDYLLLGTLMDTRTRRNLTAESMDAHNAIDFSSLPVERAIKIVKGNGSRSIAVFSDPDCPYCQKLEKDLASLTDVTVYTYLYPLERLHPEAPARAKAIWCSKDREQAWTKWMLLKQAAEPAPDCDDDPVEELVKLGSTLRINATPTLFLSNGRRVSGALSAAELEKAMAGATTVTTAGGTPPGEGANAGSSAR
jgi:thiol:disulfide interchange protein DsbC